MAAPQPLADTSTSLARPDAVAGPLPQPGLGLLTHAGPNGMGTLSPLASNDGTDQAPSGERPRGPVPGQA